ncbi:MAG: glycosyltransferase [Lachnospiraceae bacterium]|nr:glycosyltransferase [Lachnospiraceae bacterium]
MKQRYEVAQFGAFDINSYGDSLFPTVLQNGLGESVSITLFAPTKNEYGYNKNVVYAFSEFEEIHNNVHFDCIIIGGGELFHYHPIIFSNSKGKSQYKEGALWKIPLEYADKYNIPVIMNAVGVPYSFSHGQIDEMKKLLNNVVLFSVRDRYSYERLKGIIKDDILKLVPDTAWGMKDIYPKENLVRKKEQVAQKFKCNLKAPYMVLQYGTTYDLDTVIEQVEIYSTEKKINIVVIPVNYVHSDIDVVCNIEKRKIPNFMCIRELMQPEEIACIIANAQVFVGTSLHGSLTAMRYGVTSIALDMYPTIASKIDGLYDYVDRRDYVLGNNEMLADKLCSVVTEPIDKIDAKLVEIDNVLDTFYSQILQQLEEKEKHLASEKVIGVNSVSYRKLYVSYRTNDNQDRYYQLVSNSKDDVFGFKFNIENADATDLRCTFVIDTPTLIRLEETNLDNHIKFTNSNVQDVFLEREIAFVISNVSTGEVVLRFRIQNCQPTEYENAYFELLKNKNMHIQQLIASERKYLKKIIEIQKDAEKRIDSKNKIIEQKNIIINNQRGHIDQLLEVERHYQNMVNSRGWKLVSFPGRVIEKILPVGTPRRQRVSMVVKYIKALNWNNIKFVCGAFRRGGFKQVKKELNDFEYRMSGDTDLPLQKPFTMDVKEITSIAECDKLVFKKYASPKVSIVIPVYNQFTYTYYCLQSILENSDNVSYEIIIADDVSNDLTTRLSEVVENINVVRNKENQRFLRNCNNAAQYAKGEYILFLNNDTQVQENWLQPLVDLIERDDTIGMVGSKLIYPDGTLQEAGGIIWGNGNAWNYGNGQNPANPEFNYVKEVDYISGAAIMIRTSLWREIGGFDEYFAPAYCEDSDLAFEVRKHGYKLMYQPLSVVVHFEGKSNGTDLDSGVKQYQVDNSRKLQEKWKEEFSKQSPTEDDLFHAKDRSQGKKTILVIDHYVPQFDKDAGSKTTWQYLKMFVKQGYNVKFMGDNFYQDEPYCTALQQEGVEVLYGPWYAQNYKQWILDNQDNIDFAYLNRPHITEKYIDFLKEETSIKCIYYGHDLHYLRLKREYELNGDKQVLEESEEWRKKEFDIMSKADINYYPSYIEVDEIHKINSEIPAKAITAYVYDDFLENINMNFAEKEGLLFVGGFGHPPNTDAVIWFVENAYPLIRKQQDIPFYIVGSNVPDNIKRLDGKNGVVVKGFVSEEELAQLYDSCRIVVVPLRYGAGVKGKVVEALYSGTPMVSTTVGIEGIIGAEQFMEISDDANEFAEKILALYNDIDKLKETVHAYQVYVKEHNSVDAVWDIIRDDFQ